MSRIISAATTASSPLDAMTLLVGDWTLEPALNQLSAAGNFVQLEPKATAVLVYLADRPGQVVSRDALLAAVWANLVVGDDCLTQVIMKLRRALGSASYIQTISKGGYRLTAPVVRSPNIGLSAGSPIAAYGNPNRRVRRLLICSIVALTVAAGGAWWMLRNGTTGFAIDGPSSANVVSARAAQPTVAIMPFEALTNDPQELLLARGLTEDLVTDLSKVFALSVIRLTPAMTQANADKPITPPPMQYFVSGSVQHIGERLRLHVHLTDARTGQQLWSERFDRPLGGFFAIQEELGPKILDVLPAKVSAEEMRRVALRYTRNLQAYEYYQRGGAAVRLRERSGNATAREMFGRAIELDGAFAMAYAGLARTYAEDYRNQWTVDGPAALDRAFEIARIAYEISPDLPETYWVLAFVHMQRRQHQQALRYLDTAVRLSPSFAEGYALMGGLQTYIGRPAETVTLVRTAMRLEPGARHHYYFLGRAYLFLGDLEQARVNLEHALSRNPVYLDAHVYMAAVHVTAGDKAAAAWEAEEIRALEPEFSIHRWLKTNPMTDVAQKAKLLQALGELGF